MLYIARLITSFFLLAGLLVTFPRNANAEPVSIRVAHFSKRVLMEDIADQAQNAARYHTAISDLERKTLAQIEANDPGADALLALLKTAAHAQSNDLSKYLSLSTLTVGAILDTDCDIHSGLEALRKARKAPTVDQKALILERIDGISRGLARTPLWYGNLMLMAAIERECKQRGIDLVVDMYSIRGPGYDITPELEAIILTGSLPAAQRAASVDQPVKVEIGYSDGQLIRGYIGESKFNGSAESLAAETANEIAKQQACTLVIDSSGVYHGAKMLVLHGKDLTPAVLQRLKAAFHN